MNCGMTCLHKYLPRKVKKVHFLLQYKTAELIICYYKNIISVIFRHFYTWYRWERIVDYGLAAWEEDCHREIPTWKSSLQVFLFNFVEVDRVIFDIFLHMCNRLMVGRGGGGRGDCTKILFWQSWICVYKWSSLKNTFNYEWEQVRKFGIIWHFMRGQWPLQRRRILSNSFFLSPAYLMINHACGAWMNYIVDQSESKLVKSYWPIDHSCI